MYIVDAAAVVKQSRHVAISKVFKVCYASLPPSQPQQPLSSSSTITQSTDNQDMPPLSSISPTSSILAPLPPLLSENELSYTDGNVSSFDDTLTEEPPVKFEKNRLIVTDIPRETSEDVINMFFEHQLDAVIPEVEFSFDTRQAYTLITFANDYSDEGKLFKEALILFVHCGSVH